MYSMTGFGFNSSNHPHFKVEVNIKSVNSRFLETKFYMPSYYLTLEPEFKKMISKKFKRGFFVIHINRWPAKPYPEISFKWDKMQAKKWKQFYQKLSKELKFKNDLSLKDLMNREGVLNIIEKPKGINLKEKNLVKAVFLKSLKDCLKTRSKEGVSLKKDILFHLKSIQNLSDKIKFLNKKQINNYINKKNLKKTDTLLDTEKFDIHEELIRVKEHLSQFKKVTNQAIDIGRKMDFYVQEILREMNTIGSKSNLSELTLKVVEAKFALEKIKEQVQNVE